MWMSLQNLRRQGVPIDRFSGTSTRMSQSEPIIDAGGTRSSLTYCMVKSDYSEVTIPSLEPRRAARHDLDQVGLVRGQ